MCLNFYYFDCVHLIDYELLRAALFLTKLYSPFGISLIEVKNLIFSIETGKYVLRDQKTQSLLQADEFIYYIL